MSAVSQIQNSYGALVWLDFETLQVPPDVVQNALAKHGMTEVSVPGVGPEAQIRAVASDFRVAGGKGNGRWRAEVVGAYPDGTVEVALLQHHRLAVAQNADKKVQWTQDDSVVYDVNGHGWLYRGTTPVAAQFAELVNARLGLLGTAWVRQHVVYDPLTAAGAFPLRRKVGTFFFAPQTALPKVEQIAAVVAELGGEAALHVAHIQGSDASAKAVGASAREHVSWKLGDLRARISDWKDSARKVRRDALTSTMEEFAALRDHLSLYRDGLQVTVDDLQTEMEELIGSANELLGLSERNVPPAHRDAVCALISDRGYGSEISYADIAATGLPGHAEGAAWWRTPRGEAVLTEAGVEAVATATGVTFYTPGTAPAPEPKAKPVRAPKVETDARDVVRALTDAQLQGALAILGVDVPATGVRADLEAAYCDACGL